MKELKELLEVIGIDFDKLIHRLTDYLDASYRWHSNAEFRQSLSEEIIAILHYDCLPDIRVFIEQLLNIFDSMKNHPMMEDPRVGQYANRVKEIAMDLIGPTRKYVPRNQHHVKKFKEYIIELQEVLNREASLPVPFTPGPINWAEETEEGLF